MGAAAGTSTAAAVSVPLGVGSSAGVGTATAVGQSNAAGVGSSSGVGAASGIASTSGPFPLTIESNGRYFKQSDGTPFLICADTTWSLLVNIPLTGTAGIDAFLTDITGRGFNAVMGNAIEHHYTVVAPPKERSGLLPFTKQMGSATFTGSPSGTTGAAGTQGQFSADNYSNINNQAADWTFPNNAYWQNIETVLNACLAHGVLIFIWPAYLGFHVNDEGWLNEMVVVDAVTGAGGFTGASFANPAKSKLWNYGAWLADRWKTYPNIMWVMGGDYGSNTQTLSTAQKNAVNNVMDGIKSVAGQGSLFFTAHWDRPCISDDTTLTAGAFDLNFCYADDATAELCRRAYAVSPAKPAILGEYFYEAGLFGGSAPYRRYLYWGLLGGIAGTFFGHEQLWRFDDGTPGTDYTTLLATTGTLDASRLFVFFKARPWHRLRPNGLNGIGTLVTAGGGTASPQSTSYVAAAATPEGDLLLAYVPPAHTGSVTIDMTKLASTVACRWFDPTNATYTNASPAARNNTTTQAFSTPGNNNAGDADWLLVLETVSGSAAGVGAATGVGAALAAATGSSAGTSTASGVGAALSKAAGTAAGVGAATASSTNVIQGVGSAAGVATVSAVGQALAAAVGSAVGTSTATAVAIATAAGVGAAAGIGSAIAVGASIAAAVGASAGVGAATGVLAATARAAGTAAGVGNATAIGEGLSGGATTGIAVGSSIAAAVGAALGSGVGSAAGVGTATAFTVVLSPSVGTAAGTSTATAFAVTTDVEPGVLTDFEHLVSDMDDIIIDLLG